MKEDPYLTLGVDRDVSRAELKRVFRRLAMAWHPDRNDDPQATARFTEIRAAYEALLAPEDEASPEDDMGPPDMPPDGPPEAASKARSGASAGQPSGASSEAPAPETPAQAADIRLNLELSLAEAWAGCEKTVHYVRGEDCPRCAGSGEYGITRTRFCAACHGSGRVRDAQRGLIHCPDCAGRGFFSERICPDCAGSGRQFTEVSLRIKVPAGMLPGDDLRLAGQGEAGLVAIAPGDLYLTVLIRQHPVFELRGADLHLAMPLGALAMIAGAEISIPLPVGEKIVELAPGAASRRELRFAQAGYPARGKRPAGDLIVSLLPIFASQLSPRQRKLLLQAHREIDSDLPDIADWREKFRAEDVAES